MIDHPMVSFLSGWLAGCLDRHGREVMKIGDVKYLPPGMFEVFFESGAHLRVMITFHGEVNRVAQREHPPYPGA